MTSFIKSIDLQSINYVSVFIRLCMATVLGGIIGLEREKRNRPAGFRTHILVCIGATMAIMTNQYIYEIYGVGDPTRLGAQVISGIGFLGAGTIIVTGNTHVKGLTTAAGLWASACMGIAIGIGFYFGAILGGTFIFLVITTMQNFDKINFRKKTCVTIFIEINTLTAFKDVLTFFDENNIEIENISKTSDNQKDDNSFLVCITVILPRGLSRRDAFLPIRLIDGINEVRVYK